MAVEPKKLGAINLENRISIRFACSRSPEARRIMGDSDEFCLTKAFEMAAENFVATDAYSGIWMRYDPRFYNDGTFYPMVPEYSGNVKLVITGVMPLAADGNVAILNAHVLEDANEQAKAASLGSVRTSNMSVLKKGVFVQIVYDFSLRCGEAMLFAVDDEKGGQKFQPKRSRIFRDYKISSIPEFPTPKLFFDPIKQQFWAEEAFDEDGETTEDAQAAELAAVLVEAIVSGDGEVADTVPDPSAEQKRA